MIMLMTSRPVFLASILLSVFGSTQVFGEIPVHTVTKLFELTSAGGADLSKPTDVTVSKNNIYVVDGDNHRIVIYDKDGQYRKQFGKKGAGKGEFNYPVGIGNDHQGNIYVADTQNKRIQVFDEDGDYKNTINIVVDKEPAYPIDVTLSDDDKFIYVSTKSNKILIFNDSGKKIKEPGGAGTNEGSFRYPGGVASLSGGRIGVVDILNSRVQVMSKEGQFVHQVGDFGVRPGQFVRPKGVAADSENRIYISDSYMALIQVFSNTGKFLYLLETRKDPNKLSAPAGISVDSKNRLYVAEVFADRVSVFQLD